MYFDESDICIFTDPQILPLADELPIVQHIPWEALDMLQG